MPICYSVLQPQLELFKSEIRLNLPEICYLSTLFWTPNPQKPFAFQVLQTHSNLQHIFYEYLIYTCPESPNQRLYISQYLNSSDIYKKN